MARWALISGLRGDLEVYEAIQADLRHTRRVDSLFVLGDVIGPERDCNALLNRLQHPRRGGRRADALLQAVDPAPMNWLAALQFGFIELDCALLHGSSPLLLLDRLTRMDVNRLFTARNGQQFRLELSGGGIESQVRDLEGQRHHQQSVPQRQVIGIGAGVRTTLYDPGSDRLDFLLADCKPKQRPRGFA
jgi:hypothetical protein